MASILKYRTTFQVVYVALPLGLREANRMLVS
jgi:hypothetical protein